MRPPRAEWWQGGRKVPPVSRPTLRPRDSQDSLGGLIGSRCRKPEDAQTYGDAETASSVLRRGCPGHTQELPGDILYTSLLESPCVLLQKFVFGKYLGSKMSPLIQHPLNAAIQRHSQETPSRLSRGVARSGCCPTLLQLSSRLQRLRPPPVLGVSGPWINSHSFRWHCLPCPPVRLNSWVVHYPFVLWVSRGLLHLPLQAFALKER